MAHAPNPALEHHGRGVPRDQQRSVVGDPARESALLAHPVKRIDPAEYQPQERAARSTPTRLQTDKPKSAKTVIPTRMHGSNPIF